MKSPSPPEHPVDRLDLERLGWMVDSPLFIDATLVHKINDAVLCPTTLNTTETRKTLKELSNQTTSTLEVNAQGESPAFLTWLGYKLQAGLNASKQRARNSRSAIDMAETREVIDNTERRLYALTLEYLTRYKDRVLFLEIPGGEYLNHKGPVEATAIESMLNTWPRPIVFLEIEARAMLFPTMVELEEGGFKHIYKALDKIWRPETAYVDDDAKRKLYWEAIRKSYSSRTAMQTLEKQCADKRIGWIDYRLLVNESGRTSHLHVVPGGRYHTGIFAYNFIHRGYKYGCRIVGSLKHGDDINVLAIYER